MDQLIGINVVLELDLVFYMNSMFEVVFVNGFCYFVVVGEFDQVVYWWIKDYGGVILVWLLMLIVVNVKVVEVYGVDILVVIGYDEGGILFQYFQGIFMVVLMMVDVVLILVLVVGGINDVCGVKVVLVFGV